MEPIFWMGMGAAGVVSLILMRLAAKHGWAWVRDQLKQHATDVESDFKQRVAAAIGDCPDRLRSEFHSEVARLESEIATLKTKVGA
jgi:hypothetical protein